MKKAIEDGVKGFVLDSGEPVMVEQCCLTHGLLSEYWRSIYSVRPKDLPELHKSEVDPREYIERVERFSLGSGMNLALLGWAEFLRVDSKMTELQMTLRMGRRLSLHVLKSSHQDLTHLYCRCT